MAAKAARVHAVEVDGRCRDVMPSAVVMNATHAIIVLYSLRRARRYHARQRRGL